ncbi:MAG TPA: extracellular solute-binding protein [Jatrophihabitans sp.]|jgi:ABC-type Fe3+ transport system substrate-binding protein
MAAACSSGSSSAGNGSPSASVGTSLQDLYTEAKKEGKIVLWGGEDPAEMQEAFAEFSKTYPGLKLETTAVNPDQQASKLVTGKAAGQSLPDIIQGRKEFMPTLVSSKLVNTDPKWASYNVTSNIISPDGGLLEYRSVYALAYNKNSIPDKSTVPATWDALNDAKWKGQLSLDPRGFPFNILAVSKGESDTVSYVKSLKSTTSPKLVKGSTAGLVNLSAGAQTLRPAALEDVKTQLAKNAPIDFVIPTPVLVQDTLWYLTADSPDKYAALLFAIWFTSASGGQAFTATKDNRTNQLPAEAQGKQVVTYSTDEQAALVAKVTGEIATALGGS